MAMPLGKRRLRERCSGRLRGSDRRMLVRRRFQILALCLGAVLVMWLSATGVAVADPVEEGAGCDPIDTSVCLLPWPNDYFTVADPSTATGIRLNVSPLATPRSASGAPIDPADWNRLDG